MAASVEKPAKYSVSENDKLIEKLSTEEATLKWARIQGERGEKKMGFILVGALVLIGFVSICIPGVEGMEFSKTIILPAITGVLGYTLSSRRTEP